MEEIDKIIVHNLRQIGCDLDEDVTTIGQFSTELIVEATAKCLQLISPGIDVPYKLPPSMSVRYRIGGILAQACTDLGYKGDIGYQTFLYSTETDIRRVFMFLIEKLPKENEKITDETIGSCRFLKQKVCERLKEQLNIPWLPVNCRLKGIQRLDETSWVREAFTSTQIFSPVPISIKSNDQYIPKPVTEQINVRKELLPTLIHFNCEKLAGADVYNVISEQVMKTNLEIDWTNLLKSEPISGIPLPLPKNIPATSSTSDTFQEKNEIQEEVKITTTSPVITEEDKLQQLQEEVSNIISKYEELQNTLQLYFMKINKYKEQAESFENEMKSEEDKFAIQKRTCELLPEAESNIIKLQQLIEISKEKLMSLAAQWEKHKSPLVEQYSTLKERSTQRESESQRQSETMKITKQRTREVMEEIKSKELLQKQLTLDCEKISKDVSRSAYTNRILEIIGNIRKQKEEIDKVLADTRQVQKDINQLTGRLDRSFAVTDEIIFKDAKKEDTARKAYKLLATLHSDCAELVALVEETGATMREIRDLEEQVETESAKNVSGNLERITADLKQMKQESANLIAQLKALKLTNNTTIDS